MGNAKKTCDRIWEIIESGKLDLLTEVVDSDCDFKMPGMAFKGVEALRQMLSAYLAAFPDLRHHVRDSVESGDTVALELQVTGTQTGPMQTPQGVVPASGKKVIWDSCDYVRLRNGRVVSWHVYHDTVPFLTALGLLPTR